MDRRGRGALDCVFEHRVVVEIKRRSGAVVHRVLFLRRDDVVLRALVSCGGWRRRLVGPYIELAQRLRGWALDGGPVVKCVG